MVERLRGTPSRLEDRLNSLLPAVLTRRSGDTWSIQENAGHLLDLEPLWLQRVDDLLSRRVEMTPADLTNRRTHEANHNASSLNALLTGFRNARQLLVSRLEMVDTLRSLAYCASSMPARANESYRPRVFHG
ncbi:MAG: DinB family protein [bacterium]